MLSPLAVVEQEDLGCPWICGTGLEIFAKPKQHLLKAQLFASVRPKHGQASSTHNSHAQIASHCSELSIFLGNGAWGCPWVWGSTESRLVLCWSTCEHRLAWLCSHSCQGEQHLEAGPHQAPRDPRKGLHFLWMYNFCWLTGVLGRRPFVKLMAGRSCLGQRLSNDLLCGCNSANITKEPKSLPSPRAPWRQQCSNTELFLLPKMNLTGSSFFYFLISNYRVVWNM